MSYLYFNTLHTYSPLASSASHIHSFQRPLTALSSLSGYNVSVAGTGTGVMRVSAYVGTPLTSATLVSSAQVSGAAVGSFSFTSTQIAAQSAFTVQVAWLSGATNNYDLLVDTNAKPLSASAIEFVYTGSSYTFGTGNVAGTAAPKLSATGVDQKTGRVQGTGSLAISALTTTASVSTIITNTLLVAPSVYLIQGDGILFNTAVSVLSTLDGTVGSFTVDYNHINYGGNQTLTEFLRLKNQGQF